MSPPINWLQGLYVQRSASSMARLYHSRRLRISRKQDGIEDQQNDNAEIGDLLDERGAETLIDAVIEDPQDVEHVPGDGRVF